MRVGQQQRQLPSLPRAAGDLRTTADPSIALITATGMFDYTIYGVAAGSTTITIDTEGGSASATVRVETADRFQLIPSCSSHMPQGAEPVVQRAGQGFDASAFMFHGSEPLPGVLGTLPFAIDAGTIDSSGFDAYGWSVHIVPTGDATITSPIDPTLALAVKTWQPGDLQAVRITHLPDSLTPFAEWPLDLEEDVPAGHPCVNDAATITVETPDVCKLATSGVNAGLVTSTATNGAFELEAIATGDCTIDAALVDAPSITTTVTIPVD